MKEKKQKSEIREWIESAVVAVVLALLIKFFLFEFVLVEGSSMYPTLRDNDRLIITKIQYFFNEPHFKDIIILNYSDNVEYVKRVIGTPGDSVEIKNSVVYLNNEPLKETYINSEKYPDFEQIVVPKGTYFVLGDNRNNSKDSRFEDVGFVNQNDIVGKVVYRVYPFNSMEAIK